MRHPAIRFGSALPPVGSRHERREKTILNSIGKELSRQTIRDGLRAIGSKDLLLRTTVNDTVTSLKGNLFLRLLILDGGFPDAIEIVQQIRKELGNKLNILFYVDGPTKKEIMATVQAGVNDFLTAPLSQAMAQEKVSKALGLKKPGEDATSIFSQKL